MNERPDGDASRVPSGSDPPCRRYLALRNAVDEAVLEVDADGRLVDVTDAFFELSGYHRGELRGAPLSNVWHEPAADGFGEVRSRLEEPGRDVVTVEWPLRTAGGETVPSTWRFAALESEGGFRGAIATVVASRDRLEPVDGHRIQHAASRRIAAATSLSDGLEAVLRTVCERIGWEYGEAWLPMGDEDRIERATVAHCGSAEFCRFGEHSSGTTFARGEGLPGRVWASGDPEWLADVSSGDDFVRADLAEAVGLDTAFGAPVVADGHVLAVLVFATAERLPVEDHLVETVVSVGSGLGGLIARLQTEDALEHERELLERVLAASPVGIAVFEPDGSIERLNERAATVLDLEDDEDVAAYTVGDRPMFDADDERLSFEERPVNRVFETGAPVADREIQLQSRAGETRWLSVNATPIAGEDGDPEYVVSTATDVTQLKTQADRLERQRDDLRSELEEVFERVTDGFYALDDEWRFTYLNEYAEAFLDRDADDLLGKQLWTEFPNPDRRARFERAMETGTPITYEEYSVTADAWVEAHVYPSETGLSVYFRDVTERTEMQRSLRESEAKFRTVAENLDEIVWMTTPDAAEFLYVNPAYEDVWGRDRTALYDDPLAFVASIHPEDRDRVLEVWDALPGGDGEAEFRVVRPDGERRWVHAQTTTVHDDQGEVIRIVGITNDVTERVEHERELETTLDRITDAFNAFDTDWNFTYVNEHARKLLGVEDRDLIGENVWEAFPSAVGSRFEEEYRRAMETQEAAAFEEYSPEADAWLEVSAYPSETGLSVYFRDVTEREERKRELERRTRQQRAVATLGRRALETDDLDELMAEATRLVADVLDVAYCKVLERQPDAPELVVRHGVGWDEGVVGSATVPTDERSQAGYTLASGEPVAVDDFDHETRFSSPELLVDHDVSSGISAIVGAVGEQWGVLGVHDVDPREFTDDDVNFAQSVASVLGSAIDRMRTETTLRRERQLTEQIVETSPVGITVVDAEGNLRFANERAEEIFGRTKRELNALVYDGAEWDERDADGEPIEGRPFSRIMASGEPVFDELSSVRRPDGDRVWLSTSGAPLVDADGTPDGVVFAIEDVTDRRERERELERYETIVETISDGVFVLDEDGRFVMVNDAHVELTGYSREELLGEHASLITGEEVTAEARRLAEALAADDGRSHASLDALVHRPDGELVPAESRITVLTDDDGELRGRIGVARDIRDRVERERQLERQREQLAALNELNGVVREATDAIIEQSTREEIEQIVCERLAESDSYLFAWIGAVDRGTNAVRPRAQAGAPSLPEDVTIPLDPADGNAGPTSTAVQNREIQTTQHVLAEAPYEPWRERVEADDVQSAAAIPIVHEETLYGVLNVYAVRPNAFTKDERTVVGQLGEIVGHAIAAVEHKRALLSDDVIELEILVRDFFASMDVDCRDRIDFDRTVSVGDSEYLVYGTTSEAGLRTLEELIEHRPHWEGATVIADRFGDVTFELRMSESPLLSALSPYGGSRGRLVIDDGTLWMTAHVPQGSDVRQVIDSIRDVYPGAEAIARRQASTTSSSSRGIRRAWAEELTDRQRTSLETAYYAGFFEWPRHSSGEDIADSLGISPPTFHQHVRTAERKLFDALFDESG